MVGWLVDRCDNYWRRCSKKRWLVVGYWLLARAKKIFCFKASRSLRQEMWWVVSEMTQASLDSTRALVFGQVHSLQYTTTFSRSASHLVIFLNKKEVQENGETYDFRIYKNNASVLVVRKHV
jgi:hypothetical protein